MVKNGRTVYPLTSGQWANKLNSSDKPSSTHSTQKEAWEQAKKDIKAAGGGELTVLGLDGKIVSKDTIAPGNDPLPPRDKEH